MIKHAIALWTKHNKAEPAVFYGGFYVELACMEIEQCRRGAFEIQSIVAF